MKLLVSFSLIPLFMTLPVQPALAGVTCTAEAVDLFERANQADQQSRLTDARALYTQAAQQCDRPEYWMAVGNLWVNDFLGDSVESVNEEGAPAFEAFGKALEAARRDGNKLQGAAAARALAELGLRAGDPIRANDFLLLAQKLEPSDPALAELRSEVEYARRELSPSEIETGLSQTRGVGQAHVKLMNGASGSAYWNFRSEPAYTDPSLAQGGGGGADNDNDVRPQNQTIDQAIKGRSISIPINFEYNSTKTTSQTAKNIENLATVLVSDPADGTIILIGHADARGDADYNMQLSRNRANEIRLELEALQPALVGRLSVLGRGELQPVDEGDTETAYANNRRLQIVVKD